MATCTICKKREGEPPYDVFCRQCVEQVNARAEQRANNPGYVDEAGKLGRKDKVIGIVFGVTLSALAVAAVVLLVKYFVEWEPTPEPTKPALCDDKALQQDMMDRQGWGSLTDYMADHCN